MSKGKHARRQAYRKQKLSTLQAIRVHFGLPKHTGHKLIDATFNASPFSTGNLPSAGAGMQIVAANRGRSKISEAGPHMHAVFHDDVYQRRAREAAQVMRKTGCFSMPRHNGELQ